MRVLWGATVLVGCLATAGSSTVAAQGVEGYDGSNPFVCTVQDVGFGTAFPDPDADPFCVRFDKTRQNVSQLGVVEFLSQEPARVAAASDKCFYHQSDHWTGSIVQGDRATETYNFEGSYFFDKARGAGGSYVREFRAAGQTGDPTSVPGFPAEYRPFFGEGRGGVKSPGGDVEVEPRCVELARGRSVYRKAGARRCRLPGGRVSRSIGGASLRARRAAIRRSLGAPSSESRVAMRYCLDGGGTLAVGFLGLGPRRRAVVVKADHPAFRSARGVAPGRSGRSARRAMRGERVRRRRDGSRLLIVRQRRRTLIASVRRRRVAFVAVARPRVSLKTLARDLRRVR